VTFLLRSAERMEARSEAQWLKEIRDWRDSDCQSKDTSTWPSPQLASNWDRVSRRCLIHGDSCTRCHSCARCRPEQRTPERDFDVTLYLGGRGTGKTRSAAEDMAAAGVLNFNWRMAIVAPTYADARDTCVEGESGLISVLDRMQVPHVWNRSIGELIIKQTGSRYKLFSGEKPARLRGPQHHRAWVDELAQVLLRAIDSWDMLTFGLRLGKRPQIVATTTPLPLAQIKALIKDPYCAVRRGTTDDNAANLPASALRKLHSAYDGTSMGLQELGGEIVDEVRGALWKLSQIAADRYEQGPPEWVDLPNGLTVPFEITYTVMAVDPAVEERTGEGATRFARKDPDETGIIVAGLGNDDHVYILADLTVRESPAVWAQAIVDGYDAWNCNAVVIEVNNGGQALVDLIRATEKVLHRKLPIPIEKIRAKDGKRVRAEPISTICSHHLVHHVGIFEKLEDQLTTWTTAMRQSPDRMDAYVYAIQHLVKMTGGEGLRKAEGVIQRHHATNLRHAAASAGRR
jgi:phage terminase large subunit-like protein